MNPLLLFIIFACFSVCFGFDRSQIDTDPDTSPLNPEVSRNKIFVKEPFQVDLVASEPLVNEPICMVWGGDGSLYVVELRGYMQDLDNTGAQAPVGRVVRLVDENQDGIWDKKSVFIDELVEPRALLAVKGGILVGAPPNIFFCKDTNGDGVADVQKSIYDKFGSRNGNVEHKHNGLMWGLDNWIYNAKTSDRYQYIPDDQGGKIIQGKTGFRGQWGITQDNVGNLYSTINSNPWTGEMIGLDYLMHDNLSFDPMFNDLARIEPDFKTVWPIQGTADAQAGRGILRKEDRSLIKFTAIGGQTLFRGDKLGEEMVGQYFIPEPVGRLVRRGIFLEDEDGFKTLTNPEKENQVEFLASKDPNFRPVYSYTGPDGCLYIIDMYRGIIQDGNWTKEGSYLRKEIKRRNLDKNIQRGRIYRVIKKGFEADRIPKMDFFSNEQLILALAHPNGWWRDEAQKRLVLAKDRSVVPELKKLLSEENSGLGRLHAIWTLQGLNAWDKDLARIAVKDEDWRVQVAAIRASENSMLNDSEFVQLFDDMEVSNVRVAKQLILSLGLCNSKKGVSKPVKSTASQIVSKVSMKHFTNELIVLSTVVSMKGKEIQMLANIYESNTPASQSETWIRILSRVILKSGNAETVKYLVNGALKKDLEFQKMVIHSIADAIPQNKTRKRLQVNLVRFDSKPEALTQLAKISKLDTETAKKMKVAMRWFTWPGESRFDQEFAVPPMVAWEKELYSQGSTIYSGLCSACHGKEGEGVKMGANQYLAPAFAGNKRVGGKQDVVTRILLHGMTGPIDNVTYGGLMASMGNNDDKWLAAVLTYIRRSWGNEASTISEHDVRAIRRKYVDRKTPWTQKELAVKSKKK